MLMTGLKKLFNKTNVTLGKNLSADFVVLEF